MIKFIPSTGVTLPLVSYGGSSILCTIIIFAIIQGLYILRQDEGEFSERETFRKGTKKQIYRSDRDDQSGRAGENRREKIRTYTVSRTADRRKKAKGTQDRRRQPREEGRAQTAGSAKRKTSGTSGRNLEFLIITYVFLAIFLGMIAWLVYFQIFRSESVISDSHNPRLNIYEERVIRGDILSGDGVVLATSNLNEDGSQTREYPYGRMFAHAVGYVNNGKGGIESSSNFQLLRSHSFFLTQLVNDLTDQKSQGDSVVTTLNYEVQEAGV